MRWATISEIEKMALTETHLKTWERLKILSLGLEHGPLKSKNGEPRPEIEGLAFELGLEPRILEQRIARAIQRYRSVGLEAYKKPWRRHGDSDAETKRLPTRNSD